MTLPTIDTHEFTRRGDAADGSTPVAALERLVTMLTSSEGSLGWRLSGRSELRPDGSREALLRLGLDGRVRMRCVRCLETVEVPLQVARDYRLVATEAQAEREDAEDEDLDVLVGSRRFDLAALVEDEAIMALPLAPRHEDCRAPDHADTDGGASASAGAAGEGVDVPAGRNPFAALAALRPAAGPGGPPVDDGGAPDPEPGSPAPPGASRRRQG